MTKQKTITIQAVINKPAESVWKLYTEAGHIRKWNNASEDWHTPKAGNDLRVGGKFLSRMEAKDGSAGFNFEGIYNEVKINELIKYTMSDGRKVEVVFADTEEKTKVSVRFDTELENPIKMQKAGWQAILNNFKKYAEENG
jgi:uncharacterized protein YndB with AHSA1/START domain